MPGHLHDGANRAGARRAVRTSALLFNVLAMNIVSLTERAIILLTRDQCQEKRCSTLDVSIIEHRVCNSSQSHLRLRLQAPKLNEKVQPHEDGRVDLWHDEMSRGRTIGMPVRDCRAKSCCMVPIRFPLTHCASQGEHAEGVRPRVANVFAIRPLGACNLSELSDLNEPDQRL